MQHTLTTTGPDVCSSDIKEKATGHMLQSPVSDPHSAPPLGMPSPWAAQHRCSETVLNSKPSAAQVHGHCPWSKKGFKLHIRGEANPSPGFILNPQCPKAPGVKHISKWTSVSRQLRRWAEVTTGISPQNQTYARGLSLTSSVRGAAILVHKRP